MEKINGALPWRQVHFVGMGGVGMAGLALIVSDMGLAISGSDTDDSANLRLLRKRSDRITIGHRAENLPPEAELLVYSSAVPAENPERRAARERGLGEMRRGEFLAAIAPSFETVIAVAGSHGKTTVTAMLAWCLQRAGLEPGYLIGGQPVDLRLPARAGATRLLVTEVDESDTTQQLMHAAIGIVTNIDDDHCWSVGGEAALHACFRQFGHQSRQLIAGDSPLVRDLLGDHPRLTLIDEASTADLRLALSGAHNRLNAALAIAAAGLVGVDPTVAREAMLEFHGVERRQSVRYTGGGVRVIEDYAHHPAEVAATVQALRESDPTARLRVVFQPHRYERVARYAAAFGRELAAADEVIVVEPFSAWLQDASLADPRRIVEHVSGVPARYATEAYTDLAAALARESQAGDIIAVLGAGTITHLVPLLVDALHRDHDQKGGSS